MSDVTLGRLAVRRFERLGISRGGVDRQRATASRAAVAKRRVTPSRQGDEGLRAMFDSAMVKGCSNVSMSVVVGFKRR